MQCFIMLIQITLVVASKITDIALEFFTSVFDANMHFKQLLTTVCVVTVITLE